MKQEESLHSLTRANRTIDKTLQNLELRISNLQRSRQIKLKNIHSKILKHQSLISERSKLQPSKKPQPLPEPKPQRLPGIEKTKQITQEMRVTKYKIAREVKEGLRDLKRAKREQDEMEKENRTKMRNYQRLRELEGREKIDQYWNTKIDFYRNEKLKSTNDLRRKMRIQQSKLETFKREEELLLSDIRNMSAMQSELKKTMADYDVEREREKERARNTIQSWHSSQTASPKKLKYIKIQQNEA